MLHANRTRHAELQLLADLVLVIVSVWLSRMVVAQLAGLQHPLWADLVFAAVVAVGWTVAANKMHLYDNKRTEAVPSEALSALATLLLAMGAGVFAVQLAADLEQRRIFYCAFAVLSLSSLVVGRLFFGLVLRVSRKPGKDRRRVLVVGRNPAVYSLLDSIEKNQHFGVEVVGILDAPESLGCRHPAAALPLPEGIEQLGSTDDLRLVLMTEPVDEVLLHLPLRTFYVLIEDILKTCEEVGVVTKLAPDLFNVNVARRTISWVGDVPFITYFTGPKESLELAMKRWMDVVVAAAGLVVLSPIFLACVLAVRCTSKGPAVFSQRRAGLNGRPFKMLKFRSMYEDAETRKADLEAHNEMDGPVFKIRNDPRITPVGRILRRFSLDELPQLVNVLRGDMSLVGPRPPVPEEVEKYDWWQRRRLSFRPGLTCIWQVSGRNEIGFNDWMEMDLSYIDNWSLTMDLSLLLRTMRAVLTGRGAS